MREAMMDEDMACVFAALPKFGDYARLAHEYCEKFGVVPYPKNLKKLGRLLMEVAALFEQKRFRYQKRDIDVSLSVIVEGLKTVCNKRFAEPLENHNYLKKVLISLKENEGKKEISEREKYLAARESGVAREPEISEKTEVRDQRTEVSEGKRISDWIRESGIADSIGKEMP